MKAVETEGYFDKNGDLKLKKRIGITQQPVKVIILIPDDELEENENVWLHNISTNPSFDFLSDVEEDIYTIKDGKGINYEK